MGSEMEIPRSEHQETHGGKEKRPRGRLQGFLGLSLESNAVPLLPHSVGHTGPVKNQMHRHLSTKENGSWEAW